MQQELDGLYKKVIPIKECQKLQKRYNELNQLKRTKVSFPQYGIKADVALFWEDEACMVEIEGIFPIRYSMAMENLIDIIMSSCFSYFEDILIAEIVNTNEQYDKFDKEINKLVDDIYIFDDKYNTNIFADLRNGKYNV